jgi:phospholipase/carboxylesterase
MKALEGPSINPTGPAKKLVVFLHGYGADGNDLIGLAEQWRALLRDAAFVSPHAPERCAMGGMGFQWFGLSRLDPHEMRAGADAAAPALNAFLDAELARLGLENSDLALVGFSQGTMMALHVGLARPRPPAAIVGFSGMLVAPDRLPASLPPVLLVHGDSDQVVPPAALFEAVAALGKVGAVRWHLSPGLPHGIDGAGLALAGRFLADSFAGKTVAEQNPPSSLLNK